MLFKLYVGDYKIVISEKKKCWLFATLATVGDVFILTQSR